MFQEYAGIKFRDNFGFTYNGDQSHPPDKKSKGAVRGYSELLHTNIYPTSVQQVEDWLNTEVFKYVSIVVCIYIQVNSL